MKKTLCACLTALCLLLFTACDINEMSSLKDISRPYSGEYQCKTLTLGGEDMIDRFEFIKLTLDGDGDFLFRAKDKLGHHYTYDGNYEYHDDKFTFTGAFGMRKMSRDFPFHNGVIIIDLPFGGKLLHAEFSL